jgi:hypothetical protein
VSGSVVPGDSECSGRDADLDFEEDSTLLLLLLLVFFPRSLVGMASETWAMCCGGSTGTGTGTGTDTLEKTAPLLSPSCSSSTEAGTCCVFLAYILLLLLAPKVGAVVPLRELSGNSTFAKAD